MHRIEEVAEVRKVSAELMLAGRADTVALLRIQEGKKGGICGSRGESKGSGQPRHESTGMVGQPPALTLPCSPRRGPG